MSAKELDGSRRRSRPVTKPSIKTKMKRNKSAMLLAIFIVFMMVFSGMYVIFSGLNIDEDKVAVIETNFGTIKVDLYDNEAPKTCENFIKLANEGFYDGLVFHRVIDDFMIQGGGFTQDRTKKESDSISTFEGGLSHIDGAISMASTDAKVPGTSQFFICDGAQTGLDGDYAVFGKTIEGIEVVREIAQVQTTTKYLSTGQPMNDWPVADVIINSITITDK